jgi:hypothetical protein
MSMTATDTSLLVYTIGEELTERLTKLYGQFIVRVIIDIQCNREVRVYVEHAAEENLRGPIIDLIEGFHKVNGIVNADEATKTVPKPSQNGISSDIRT